MRIRMLAPYRMLQKDGTYDVAEASALKLIATGRAVEVLNDPLEPETKEKPKKLFSGKEISE